MKSETSPAPETLQRLIDGELSTAEVKQMLLVAEQHPAHWRAIACEFVEDQLFQKQFEHYSDSADTPKAKPVSASKIVQETNRKSSFAFRQLAIAAGIAVAGLLGYLAGNDSTLPIDNGPMAGDVGSNMLAGASESNVPSALTPVSLEPEYQLELLTPDGQAINGEVDLYRYQDVNRLYANKQGSRPLSLDDVLPPSGISNEMRQRLTRSGYGINESTNYVSGQLEDGRQFVVPVRSIRFDRGH